MRHLLGRRLGVARDRRPVHVDARRDHQPVPGELVAAGERHGLGGRIDGGRAGGRHLDAERGERVVRELLCGRLAQARDHRAVERAGAERLAGRDQRDVESGSSLRSARAQAAPAKPPPTTTTFAAPCAEATAGARPAVVINVRKERRVAMRCPQSISLPCAGVAATHKRIPPLLATRRKDTYQAPFFSSWCISGSSRTRLPVAL